MTLRSVNHPKDQLKLSMVDRMLRSEWRLVRRRGKRLAIPRCRHYPANTTLGRRKDPLMHPWVRKWTCTEPYCWQCINLCKPKRAISESQPMRVWLFPHLQPLTAVTLNQCLWIVWLGHPPYPPQSKACLILYILSTLIPLHCLPPIHFYSSLPKGAFYFYYKILILFDDRHLTQCP